MKKTIWTVLAALLVAVPAVQAQKVNKEALLAKIEKSDADIANEKKATKAATWINRGKAYMFPGVDAFLKERNPPEGYILVTPIPGLLDDDFDSEREEE